MDVSPFVRLHITRANRCSTSMCLLAACLGDLLVGVFNENAQKHMMATNIVLVDGCLVENERNMY